MKIMQIGTGRWGTNHLRVWSNLQVELYVAEVSEPARKKCIEQGIPADHVTDDYRKFLDKVSAVDIVTPASTHHKLGMEMLHLGKDVFMEKPIAETAKEAQELADAAMRSKSIFQPGHIFRFDPAAEFVKCHVDAGHAGRIQAITGSFYGFKRPRTDGGVAISDAIHFVDFYNFVMGRLPVKIFAKCNDILKRNMDDLSWIWMDYGDTPALVEANYFYPDKKRMITVIGEKETIVCDFASSQDKIMIHRNRHILDNETWRTVSGEIVRQEILPAEPLLLELKHFMKCAQDRTAPIVSAQDGADAVRIVEKALESHRQGREVALN